MMKIKLALFIIGTLMTLGIASCSSGTSYAELLRDERKITNKFLAQYRIVNEIPADTIFETGEDAPFYRIEEDGNVYMQVIKAGSLDNRPSYGDHIYFRFAYFSLFDWEDGEYSVSGNSYDMQNTSTDFYYGNYNVQVSYTWGYGLQLPLQYVGVDSEVNLVVKSQYGFSDNIANVVPYHFNVRYFTSPLD